MNVKESGLGRILFPRTAFGRRDGTERRTERANEGGGEEQKKNEEEDGGGGGSGGDEGVKKKETRSSLSA